MRPTVIHFRCSCGKELHVSDEDAGQPVTCPDCGQDVSAPRQESGDAVASSRAIASLVLGILSFFCACLSGVPAIILGILGLQDVNRSRGRKTGQGLAIAGIVMGSLGTVGTLCLTPVLVGVLLPAVQKVREAANRMSGQNQLKQMALAMINYQATNGRFPPQAVYSKDGKPLYSWRVLLLPYLEEDDLYKQFKLDEPWDSDHNIKLLERMPKVFGDPSTTYGPTMTVYKVFVGEGAAFEGKTGLTPADFPDGTSNTLMIVESATPGPWSSPEDLPFTAKGALPTLGGHHTRIFNAVFVDGAVRALPDNIDDATLRALITRNGGERVQIPQMPQ
jgi:hypothetical protein